MRVVIIGGVAAGMSAASKLKRLNKDAEIIVFERGKDVSYGACGMPYYISDVIKDEDALIARRAEAFQERGIDVRLEHRVINVDPKAKQVKVEHTTSSHTFEQPYDTLIIATGASAIRLPVEGKALQGIHTLNSLEDARQLKPLTMDANIKHVTVVGAGFIGLEVVESFLEQGKTVTLIERESHILPAYDAEVLEPVETMLKDKGVALLLSQSVKAYQGDGRVNTVITGKREVNTDLVVEAIGVRPNTAFLDNTELNRLDNGALIVDEHFKTNLEDIYAAGDCATVPHALLEHQPVYVPLGTHANKGGRIIAENINGNPEAFPGVIGSNQLKCVDYEIAKTGLSETEAKHHNIEVETTFIKAKNQAGYYPGAQPLYVKLIVNKANCHIIGAQLVGKKDAALRINTIAVAIQQHMTAKAFSQLDLAYAPPFSPVYDPLLIAAQQIKCDQKKGW